MAINLMDTASGHMPSLAGFGKVGLMFFMLIAIVGIIAFSIYYVRNSRKYKIDVEIYRKLGDNWMIIKDKGASMRKQGIEYLRLKKLRKNLPFPAFKHFLFGAKARGYLKMIQTSVGRIEPLSLEVCNPEHTVKAEREQSNWDLWYVSEGELIEKAFAFKSKLMQLLPYIGVIILVVGVVIVLALIVQQLAPIADQLAGIKDGLGQVAGRLTGLEQGGSGW